MASILAFARMKRTGGAAVKLVDSRQGSSRSWQQVGPAEPEELEIRPESEPTETRYVSIRS